MPLYNFRDRWSWYAIVASAPVADLYMSGSLRGRRIIGHSTSASFPVSFPRVGPRPISIAHDGNCSCSGTLSILSACRHHHQKLR